jgi:chemotaxis protein methyltransferase CheR
MPSRPGSASREPVAGAGEPRPAARALRDDEFALFQALIRRESGIALGPHKRQLLIARLAPRLRALGARSFAEYHRRVTTDGTGEELTRMLDCICTNETRFFREPSQFEFLKRSVIPSFGWSVGASAAQPTAAGRRIRVWSAACSTGEEPYSLAMTLLDRLPAATDILATDLSTRVLEHARRAVWPLERSSEIPAEYLHAYMLRGKGARAGFMKAGPEIRRLVTFQRLNLTEAAPSRLGRFDLVFCRNVLIYFDAATKARLVEVLIDCLAPGGYLFLGHAENLSGLTDRMRSVAPAVYCLR